MLQYMLQIAKSQAAKGLQGSAIKASLAQLSQRCRVMLVPLTEKEINYFTRYVNIFQCIILYLRLQYSLYVNKVCEVLKASFRWTVVFYKDITIFRNSGLLVFSFSNDNFTTVRLRNGITKRTLRPSRISKTLKIVSFLGSI